MSDTLIKVEGVSKKFCRGLRRSLWYGMQDLGSELIGRRHGSGGGLRPEEFWAVNDVSFELKRGECLGLIGRNGAGKTTLLRMLNGLIKPDAGRIEMKGRIGALISLGAGFNPILTGRENIYVNASVLGLSKREVDDKIDEIIDFSEIGDFVDAPVQSYSSGMQVKLGFAVATAAKPDILLIDEVLSVGDLRFRAKSYQRLGELMADSAIIIVSHNEAQLYRLCDKALWLEKGLVSEAGEACHVLDSYCAAGACNSPITSSKLLSKNIMDLSVEVSGGVLTSGGDVKFEFEISAREDIALSSLNLHLSRAGNFVCHASANFKEKDALILSKGASRIQASISVLPLVQGDYSVSIILYENSDRTLVAQINDCAHIHIEGAPPSSSYIYLPLCISQNV